MNPILRQLKRAVFDGPTPKGAEVADGFLVGERGRALRYRVGEYEVSIRSATSTPGYLAWVSKDGASILDLSVDNGAWTMRGAKKKAQEAIDRHRAATAASA